MKTTYITFPALAAELSLNARVYDGVQIKVLAALEPFAAHGAHVRPLRVVAQLVPLQMLLALQPTIG